MNSRTNSNRPLRRLVLAASALALPLSLSFSNPVAAQVQEPVSGVMASHDMLLAGTGYRGTKMSSLFSRKRRLPKENGEDFVDPDFEDYVGPAGRQKQATATQSPAAAAPSETSATVQAPPALPPEGDVSELGADIGSDLDVAAEPAVGLPTIAIPDVRNYEPVELDPMELFPANVVTSEVSTGSRKNFARALFGDKSEPTRVTKSFVIAGLDQETWPKELYPDAVVAPFDVNPQVDGEYDAEPAVSDLPALAEIPDELPTVSPEELAAAEPLDDALLPPLPGESADALVAATADLATRSKSSADEYWQPKTVATTTGGTLSQSDGRQTMEPTSLAAADPVGVASTASFAGWRAASTGASADPVAPAMPQAPSHIGHPLGDDEQLVASNESLDITPPAIDVTEPPADPTEELNNRGGLTGLKGFCPVTLCEHRDLIDADPRFAAVYEDRTYYVSTYEALVLFQENPGKYAPVNGGNDIVALARDGVEIEGVLDHAAWYRGKLYLFATSELLADFSADPRRYAVK